MATEQAYSVRAIPVQGHDRRWRCDRPWTREPVIVRVVDKPQSPKTEKIGDRVTITYSDEISPVQLAELKGDPHIAVALIGEGGSDPDEINDLKLKLSRSEVELEQARKDHQQATEELKEYKRGAAKREEELGQLAGSLQEEVTKLKADLSKRSKKAKE